MSYLWCDNSWGGLDCCNRYNNLPNKVRLKQNQLTYNTNIHNPLCILLRREANTTSLTLLNLATCYWSACTRPGKWAVMYLYVRGIDFAPFCDFGIVRTMWYFWNCSDNVVNCSDNVAFLELFGQCSIFGIVRTM